MKLIFLSFFFGLTMGLQIGLSQTEVSGLKSSDSSEFIEDLSDALGLKVYAIDKFNRFSVTDHDLGSSLYYSPNSSLNLGIGATYKWFGLGLAFNFPFINNDDQVYGNTRRFDAQTSFYGRKFIIDFYLQVYQGYYIENPDEYKNDWNEADGYPIRPDIATTSFAGSFTWIFNHEKFSAKSTFIQTELQKKSAGSLLAGGFFNLLGVYGDSAIIPNELHQTFKDDLLFNSVSVGGIGISVGYSHTFVIWKNLNINLTIAPGISTQSFDVAYPNSDSTRTGNLVSGRVLARAGILYSSRKAFGGMTVSNDSFSGNTGQNQRNSINFDLGVIRFFYGRRIFFNNKKTADH